MFDRSKVAGNCRAVTFHVVCLKNFSRIIIAKGFYTAVIERVYALAGLFYSGVILDDAKSHLVAHNMS